MVLIVARQVSAAEETAGGKNCGKHPKHCNLTVLLLKNTSQDTFRHQVVSFIMNNELSCCQTILHQNNVA